MTDIYKINSGLTTSAKIELLNNMILQLAGLTAQGKFDVNELNEIFSNSKLLSRRYLRGILLGNTTSDYTDWSHFYAETGYSIWKLTPDNYGYNVLNQLYLDDIELDNRGLALSESLSGFDKVFNYDGSSYTDDTTEATTESGTEFPLMVDTGDYLYVGLDAKFSGIDFKWQTKGSNYDLVIEYWNDSYWQPLTANLNDLNDATQNFISDGIISFTEPNDWAITTVNSIANKYWIRISTTTVPSITAEAYLVIPANNVISLLSLSSEEFQKEQWAWCSYNDSIYVTIRNTGVSAYEGDAFVSSASSTTNKQNFFIYNHAFSADYEDSSWIDGAVTLIDGATVDLDASLGDGVFELTALGDRTINAPTNEHENNKIIIRHKASGGARTLSVYTGVGGFRFSEDITGLTVTTSGKTDYIGAIYNVNDDYWDIIGYIKGY